MTVLSANLGYTNGIIIIIIIIKTEQLHVQQYGDWYTTLAVDGWAVTFGTAMRGRGGLRPRPIPSSLYRMQQPTHQGGGMAEWLASPDWDREVVGSNPGVARSDGQ